MKRLLQTLAAVLIAFAVYSQVAFGHQRWGDVIQVWVADAIAGTTGGAPFYYARFFDSGSSSSDGIVETIAHCESRFSGRGCKFYLNSGVSESSVQIILSGGVHMEGAGGGTTSASRLNLVADVTTANGDCAGEGGGSHVDNADPQCPFVLVAGSDVGIKGVHIDSSGGGVSRADVTLEVMSQILPTQVTSSGLDVSDVTLSGASSTNFFLSARDGAAAAQADQMTLVGLRLLAFNTSIPLPKHQMFLDQPNTSGNLCINCVIGASLNSSIYFRLGYMSFIGSNGHNGQAQFPVYSTTAHIRHCKDALSASDSTDPITCATPPNGGASILRMDGYHWEEGSNTDNYGPFLVNEGTAYFKAYIARVTLFWDWVGTFDVISWNSQGTLTIDDNDFLGGPSAGLGIIDIDCDTANCTNVGDSTQLLFSADKNHREAGEAEWSVDYTDVSLVLDDLIDPNVPPIAKTANATITRAECQGGIITNRGASGAILLTLPPPETGLTCIFILEAAQDVDIVVPGATTCSLGASCDRILAYTNANGDNLSSDAAIGSMFALKAVSTDEWFGIGFIGVWPDVN